MSELQFSKGTIEIENIMLRSLSIADSNQFHSIYSTQKIIDKYGHKLIRPKETEVGFTKRIVGSSNYIWTIRLSERPKTIIGVCALHHWDKKKNRIEIGGTLMPDYWGNNIMKKAFNYLIEFAFKELDVECIVGRTDSKNVQAIKMVAKLGFRKDSKTTRGETVMKKYH